MDAIIASLGIIGGYQEQVFVFIFYLCYIIVILLQNG